MTHFGRYVTCTNCSLDVSIDGFDTVLIYHLPDGREVQVQSCTGWCRNCEAIRATEPVLNAVLNAEAIKLDLECLEAQPFPRPSRFRWLLGRRRPKRNPLEEKHADLQAQLSLVQMRKSAPRCLECESADIQPLGFDTLHRAAGLDHDCGGQLRWHVANFDPTTCFYRISIPHDLDPEGHQLVTEVKLSEGS